MRILLEAASDILFNRRELTLASSYASKLIDIGRQLDNQRSPSSREDFELRGLIKLTRISNAMGRSDGADALRGALEIRISSKSPTDNLGWYVTILEAVGLIVSDAKWTPPSDLDLVARCLSGIRRQARSTVGDLTKVAGHLSNLAEGAFRRSDLPLAQAFANTECSVRQDIFSEVGRTCKPTAFFARWRGITR
jgi:hypothetical protein